jgi:hypothetical protein
LFILRSIKCELMVEVMMGMKVMYLLVMITHGLITVNVIEITFVGLHYYFARF